MPALNPVPTFKLRGRLPAVAAGVAALAVAASAWADPPVWHVRGAKAQITLFGSVHLLAQDTHWRTPALVSDLAKADDVWFEIPVGGDSQASAGELARSRGLLPPEQSLSPLLSPVAQARLSHLCATLGVAQAVLERMQPWLAELSVSVLYYQARGARPDLGVEEQIARDAPALAKREAFETIGEQIGFFADFSQKDQVASLEETLEQIEQDPDTFERLASAWVRGDTRAIVREAVDPMRKDTPALYARLLVDRNRRWVRAIEALLNSDRRIFIVVGVGHLVGQDSVPSLLRRDGVRVEGP